MPRNRAGSAPLRTAAWRGVVSVAGPNVLSGLDRAHHQRRLSEVLHRLAMDDAAGRFWPAGTLAEARELAALDSRFQFVRALPRSALFGEAVANAFGAPAGAQRSGEPGDGVAAGRLTNMFITCFDGICDETPELLPATVPYLNHLHDSIPRSVPPPPPTPHPLVSLTHSIAAAVAGLLVSAFHRRGDELGELVLGSIREAYGRQFDTLRIEPRSAANRARLSTATFAVSLASAALFNGLSREQAESLVRAATPVGELFGWIDDVVDLDRDTARGIPNLAAQHVRAQSGLSGDPAALAEISEQTGRRWRNAVRAGEDLHRTGIIAGAAFDVMLRDATWAWLGFPTLDER